MLLFTCLLYIMFDSVNIMVRFKVFEKNKYLTISFGFYILIMLLYIFGGIEYINLLITKISNKKNIFIFEILSLVVGLKVCDIFSKYKNKINNLGWEIEENIETVRELYNKSDWFTKIMMKVFFENVNGKTLGYSKKDVYKIFLKEKLEKGILLISKNENNHPVNKINKI